MSDPWAFGWTQLLTIIGFIITASIAIGGFRTFNRWKREKLEEKKIDVAFEALTLAYESKHVFAYLNPDPGPGFSETEAPRARDDWRKRLEESRDFFDRVWKIQPRCMALFGSEVEEIFRILHVARLHFESRNTYRDLHDGPAFEGSEDIEDFRKRLENICRPIIDRRFRSLEIPARMRIGRGGFRLTIRRPPPSAASGTTKVT